MTKLYIGSDTYEVTLNSGQSLTLTVEELKEIAADSPEVERQLDTMQRASKGYEQLVDKLNDDVKEALKVNAELSGKLAAKELKIDGLQDQLDLHTNFGRSGK